MMAIFKKKSPQIPKLPRQCDICHESIGLCQPWYSVAVKSHFCNESVKDDVSVLCPNCFAAYELRLVEQRMRATHGRLIRECMHPD